VEATFSLTGFRGKLPGFYAPLQANPLNHYDESTGNVGLPGATLVALANYNANTQGRCFIDIFGPWT